MITLEDKYGIDLEEKVPLEMAYKILLEEYKSCKERNLDMIDVIYRKNIEIKLLQNNKYNHELTKITKLYSEKCKEFKALQLELNYERANRKTI